MRSSTYIMNIHPGIMTLCALILCLGIPAQLLAQNDYLQMSLEELMNVEVTSVSKSKSTFSESPAAIFVINSDDIRRSGATSIPELLRSVPGMDVARISGNRWAVSSRGFNYPFANKLLVLVDGRTIYNSVFSGVFWEEHEMMLDDIERIEVIRGPGAAVWGANAVNGVINIISKHSKDTTGTLVSASAGNIERTTEQVRQGGSLGESGHYRIYGRYSNNAPLGDAETGDSFDSSESFLTGIRTDLKPGSDDELMFQAAANWLTAQQTYIRNYPAEMFRYEEAVEDSLDNFYAQSHWQHAFSSNSHGDYSFYYNHYNRSYNGVDAELDTFEFEAQHEYQAMDWLKFVSGASYRGVSDSFSTESSSSMDLTFSNPERYTRIASAFLHSEVELLPKELTMTLGAKVENNSYTGFEWEPNLRFSYLLNENHTLWAAWSRAVRMPARINDSIDYNLGAFAVDPTTGLPVEVHLSGNPAFNSENLLAYEAGYRGLLSPSASLDLAVFYNRYADLETIEPVGLPSLTPEWTLFAPATYANMQAAETWGAETALTISPAKWLRLRTSYTLFEMETHPDPLSQNVSDTGAEGMDPESQIRAQLSMDLPYSMEWDLMWSYTSKLSLRTIDDYQRLDTRLGATVAEGLTLSLVLQNLLDEHYEFTTNAGLYAEMAKLPRMGYLKLDYRF